MKLIQLRSIRFDFVDGQPVPSTRPSAMRATLQEMGFELVEESEHHAIYVHTKVLSSGAEYEALLEEARRLGGTRAIVPDRPV